MTNKGTSHQHGLHSMNATRPKAKGWKQRNKAKARLRREARQAAPKTVAAPKAKAEAPKEEAKKD